MSKRKPYERPLPTDWWLKNAFYTKYMIREGSSIFITIYSLILAWGVFRLSQGEVAFDAWMAALHNPFSIIVHLIALALALYHTVTWFSLAPKAMALWIKGKRLQDKVIIVGHYCALVAVAIFCLVIITL
ncbi:fumarate reductase subunit C [Psychromonas sp.]|uniref:fumarate reductase subunit C n=1 Tax=Psychromonas sp. TaxID=1884585 RepID=UPI0039E67057